MSAICALVEICVHCEPAAINLLNVNGQKTVREWGKDAFPSRLGIAHKQLLIQSNKYFNPFLLSFNRCRA